MGDFHTMNRENCDTLKYINQIARYITQKGILYPTQQN